MGSIGMTEIGDKLWSMLDGAQRLDIIFDVYQKGSLESKTNEGRNNKDRARLYIKKHNYLKKFLQSAENGWN